MINDLEKPTSGFYAEWVSYEDCKEREEAFDYLRLWKKFLLKKLPSLEQVGFDQIIERNDIHGKGFNTLGIKIELRLREDGEK